MNIWNSEEAFEIGNNVLNSMSQEHLEDAANRFALIEDLQAQREGFKFFTISEEKFRFFLKEILQLSDNHIEEQIRKVKLGTFK
jgi:hypothetical protein